MKSTRKKGSQAQAFFRALPAEAPPASCIESLCVEECDARIARMGFAIAPSPPRDRTFMLTSPDLAMCAQCGAEIDDPADRPFGYAFILHHEARIRDSEPHIENYETLHLFEEILHNLQSVYQSVPELLVYDLHPEYLSTRWALANRNRSWVFSITTHTLRAVWRRIICASACSA